MATTTCVSCQNPCTQKCEMCNKTLYCSEACSSVGWAKHQEDCNVVDIPNKSVGLFIPYYGEDLEADIPDELCQSYILKYRDPSGSIQQRMVPSIRFDDRSEEMQGPQALPVEDLQYDIHIDYLGDEDMEPLKSWTIPGLTGESTAIMETSHYSKNKELSEYMNKEDGYVFWAKKPRNITVPKEGGYLKVSMEYDGRTVAPLIGEYAFSTPSVPRNAPINKINQIKFGLPLPSNLQTLRLTNDDTGNSVRLTFDRTEGKLVDIEYHITEDALVGGGDNNDEMFFDKVEFACDGNSLEQVTGLVQALSDRIGDGTLSGNHIQQQYNIISTYRDELEKGMVQGPSIQINAAIKQATDVLWEATGKTLRQFFYDQKGGYARRKDTKAKEAQLKTMSNDELVAFFKLQVEQADSEQSLGNVGSEFLRKAQAAARVIHSRQGLVLNETYRSYAQLLNTLKGREGALKQQKRQKAREFAKEIKK